MIGDDGMGPSVYYHYGMKGPVEYYTEMKILYEILTLGKDATLIMRQEKRKVRYVFEGEEENKASPSDKLIKEKQSPKAQSSPSICKKEN